MSRLARIPVTIPQGVTVKYTPGQSSCEVAGPKGILNFEISPLIKLDLNNNQLSILPASGKDYPLRDERMYMGTARAILGNMVQGVAKGFEQKLDLVGVGYRVKVAGSTVSLSLGYSHPIDYALPKGVTAEAPSQAELLLKSHDKRLLGQVASDIRAFRPPEPYKGKGVKYSDEQIQRKEAKKK